MCTIAMEMFRAPSMLEKLVESIIKLIGKCLSVFKIYCSSSQSEQNVSMDTTALTITMDIPHALFCFKIVITSNTKVLAYKRKMQLEYEKHSPMNTPTIDSKRITFRLTLWLIKVNRLIHEQKIKKKLNLTKTTPINK